MYRRHSYNLIRFDLSTAGTVYKLFVKSINDYVIVKEVTVNDVTVRTYFIAYKNLETNWTNRASLTYSGDIQDKKLVNEGQNWYAAATGIFFKGLLDSYGDAAAAYSLERLSKDYKGSAVEVRRDSDNAVLDIGFVDNVLDTTALTNFCTTPVVVYQSDFSVSENLAEFNAIGSIGNTIGGVSDAYKLETVAGGNGIHQALKNLSINQKYNISFDYYIPSTNSVVDGIKVEFITGGFYDASRLDSWQSVNVTLQNVNISPSLVFRASQNGEVILNVTGDVFYLKNIVINQVTSNGYVTKWYDQSGLGFNAIQTTASAQPKIYDSIDGVVMLNGKPSIEFGRTSYLQTVDTGVDLSIEQIQMVAYNNVQITSTSSSERLLTTFGAAGFEGLAVGAGTRSLTGETFTILNNGAAREAITDVIDAGLHLFTIDWTGSSHNIYLDSNTGSFINVGTPVQLNSRQLTIGGRPATSLFNFGGAISELIIYTLDQTPNRLAIESNINSRYNIYLTTSTTYNVEDYPLNWIDGLYYTTYKDNTFEVSSNEGIKSETDYAAVTNINLSNQSLTTDFTGTLLNKFSNLTDLICFDNQISILDVSALTSLDTLRCENNQITTLDVSALTSLTYLGCNRNQISVLDVSALTSLTAISCFNNQISILDVSQLINLSTLRCDNNQIDAATNSQILVDLDGHGLSNGYFQSSIFGGGTLTTAGQTAKSNLLSKGWTIIGI